MALSVVSLYELRIYRTGKVKVIKPHLTCFKNYYVYKFNKRFFITREDTLTVCYKRGVVIIIKEDISEYLLSEMKINYYFLLISSLIYLTV
jgi:hypothetical protein